jgi:hypothetical protein
MNFYFLITAYTEDTFVIYEDIAGVNTMSKCCKRHRTAGVTGAPGAIQTNALDLSNAMQGVN